MLRIDDIKIKYKINIISFTNMFLFIIITIVLYYAMNNIKNINEENYTMSRLSTTILSSMEQGLQVSNALRGIIISPDDTKAKENFIQAVKELDDLMLVLKDSTKKFQGFEKFEIAPLYDSQSKVLNKIIEKIKNGEALTKEDNTLSTKEWRPLKAALLKWQERNLEKNEESKQTLNEITQNSINIIIISIIVGAIFIQIIIALISKNIVFSINHFQTGLLNFFSYLNRQSPKVDYIDINSEDEFGAMAKVVNENIKKSNEILLNEEQVLEQIEKMIQNIERGFFMYRIKLKCENQQIETIRNNINALANNLQMKISSISNVLLDFGESHFESRVPEDLDMVGTYGSLKSSTRLVGNNVSELLAMILTTGDKLNEDTTILSASSQNLSINANEAAASLEETAASLEEITSNIRNNTQSIAKMSALSFNVTKSVKEGEELANQTTIAMDEINTQVNLVNEAISVIDNIAFQTNILSLNAAVEAATAGEAGKGFAVVAQEVRNLASRSAEAAKEIKDIVELATKKANEGKEIANSMIEGYKDLNSNVSQTVTLISDIEMASKEQLLGIEQINDAVNNLDAQTQQNAMVSNQINDLSREVSELSSKLVSAANLADYSKKTKDYICNVDLVFKTAKLKNDHIRFKENNFAKLGNNERWTVVSCNDCNLGKWIKESEQNQEKYTKTQSWNKLKDYHADIHNSVQKYIDEDVEVNPKVNLKDLAIDIEILTSHIFDELNMVKKNVCLEKPEIS
ncbi:methyl-accepting chemotaxis protein [Aliarcobacter butzleri]|uniref:methyl-accepting chemotaxis protein n=1 Tax=Aliarcobacter butzleri TaxID=28197 RepID=UPI0021B27FD3|nr:methyl-accepting chemotaxis protein [Aliarcobacter butzleri]MCT7593808.1 methyl-accepting chemotaxis protein [Aliarcobacter butzleri]MCT7598436.1 methyl-accepting chemotaxis protein [Aliarcobacter butzleri]MCT7652096.1 methyl-accepting chemotaxis protein [Aliarcobacter butzleri]UWY61206.1 methyl-accepting chemotaxis protein [Aliarcobacter butzleri]